MCDTLLLSTYHAIVHFLLLMVIFSLHLSYVFTMNPCDFIVFEYISYHIIADSIHPYISSRSRRYSTFTPFSTRTFFLCLSFTSHIMSANLPSIFIKMNLSFGMSELMFAPCTSKIATYITLCASIIRLMNRSSR